MTTSKTTRGLALLLLAGATGTAVAQPGAPLPPPTDPLADQAAPPADPLAPSEPPPPPSPPSPPVAPAPPPPPPPAAEPASTGRPEGLSFGIGVGYTMPADLQNLNTASVRIRLEPGLTFEPIVTLARTTLSTDDVVDTDDSVTELTLGTMVRQPVIRHGKVELEVLGFGQLSRVNTDPEGPDNAVTQTALGVGWGLAVSYWLTRHWDVTLSGTNGLLSWRKQSQSQPAPGSDVSISETRIAVEFDPTVFAMIHLYN